MWCSPMIYLRATPVFDFINDLPLFVSGTVSSTDLYADGTTIYDAQVDLYVLKATLQNTLMALR